MTNTYRAAMWISEDKQATVRLTLEDQAALTDDELLDAAKAEAENVGLVLEGGEIIVTTWTE